MTGHAKFSRTGFHQVLLAFVGSAAVALLLMSLGACDADTRARRGYAHSEMAMANIQELYDVLIKPSGPPASFSEFWSVVYPAESLGAPDTEPAARVRDSAHLQQAPNPFPHHLPRGRKYGRLERRPPGANPAHVPLMWDLEPGDIVFSLPSSEGNLSRTNLLLVLFWNGELRQVEAPRLSSICRDLKRNDPGAQIRVLDRWDASGHPLVRLIEVDQ